VVQRLVFELFLLIARHGIDAEDLMHLIKLFDTEHAPVVSHVSLFANADHHLFQFQLR